MEPFLEAACGNIEAMGRALGEGLVFLNTTDLICFCQLVCRHKVI